MQTSLLPGGRWSVRINEESNVWTACEYGGNRHQGSALEGQLNQGLSSFGEGDRSSRLGVYHCLEFGYEECLICILGITDACWIGSYWERGSQICNFTKVIGHGVRLPRSGREEEASGKKRESSILYWNQESCPDMEDFYLRRQGPTQWNMEISSSGPVVFSHAAAANPCPPFILGIQTLLLCAGGPLAEGADRHLAARALSASCHQFFFPFAFY